MEVTIDIEPRTYSLLTKAKELGISIDDAIEKALENPRPNGSQNAGVPFESWLDSFHNWIGKSKNSTCIPSEELRRENLYEDRI